jgi:hypothetical protein
VSGATTFVNAGDTVTFSVTPSTSVGFAAIQTILTNYNRGTVPGYGLANARFYFGKIDECLGLQGLSFRNAD